MNDSDVDANANDEFQHVMHPFISLAPETQERHTEQLHDFDLRAEPHCTCQYALPPCVSPHPPLNQRSIKAMNASDLDEI